MFFENLILSDFKATKAADIKNNILAETVRHFKEDEEGVRAMCRIMEEIREEGKTEGREEGEVIGKVKLLYQDFEMSVSEIALKLKMSEEQVENIVKEEILCIK